jgi:hypothetical protein
MDDGRVFLAILWWAEFNTRANNGRLDNWWNSPLEHNPIENSCSQVTLNFAVYKLQNSGASPKIKKPGQSGRANLECMWNNTCPRRPDTYSHLCAKILYFYIQRVFGEERKSRRIFIGRAGMADSAISALNLSINSTPHRKINNKRALSNQNSLSQISWL